LYYDEDDYDEDDLDVANNLNVIAESNFNDNNVNRKKLIITKTNIGNPNLCHGGYYYTVERASKGKVLK
jgi:hypothetical protein